MQISYDKPLHFWNYFLALEDDLLNLSRYIEFTEDNMKTYSVECNRLFLSASSEVGVVFEQIYNLYNTPKEKTNMQDYFKIIKKYCPGLVEEKIILLKYHLETSPFYRWEEKEHLCWWMNYNAVKHHRLNNFKQANLGNVIDSVAALFIVVHYYYLLFSRQKVKSKQNSKLTLSDVIHSFNMKSELFRFKNDTYYYIKLN